MQRVVAKTFGGPEQLTIEEVAQASRPAPGQVLVDVEAAGVNYVDVYQRQGTSNVSLPFTPGLEGVGRVREVGEGIDSTTGNLAIGRRVAWINVPASYADQVLVPAEQAVRVPDSFTRAQALLFQATTAQYLVSECRNVRPGDPGARSLGCWRRGELLVQWLKHLGAVVAANDIQRRKAATVRALRG